MGRSWKIPRTFHIETKNIPETIRNLNSISEINKFGIWKAEEHSGRFVVDRLKMAAPSGMLYWGHERPRSIPKSQVTSRGGSDLLRVRGGIGCGIGAIGGDGGGAVGGVNGVSWALDLIHWATSNQWRQHGLEGEVMEKPKRTCFLVVNPPFLEVNVTHIIPQRSSIIIWMDTDGHVR